MPSTILDSAVFRDIFTTPAMRNVFSDENRVQKYLDFEAALARAQGKLGIIPKNAAAEIVRHCDAKNIDMAKLKEATERIGYPVLPVVQQLVKLCKDGLGEWSHWGATTQDITDTATVMQMREALDILEQEIDAIADALAALAKKYRDTPMAGRSNLQQAVPITFGYKMATLLGAFERHKQRLAELRPRVLVGEFGGAAGTLSSLGKDGLKVQAELMQGAQARPARYFLAHRARPHRRGRLLPRPGHRHLRQDRLRREAADADRSGGSLRAVPRRPRLVLDHAAEAQPDLVGLHHRAGRDGETAGGRAAGGAGRGPRALHRPVGNRMDRTAGNLHAVGRRAGADALPGERPAGQRKEDARKSRHHQRADHVGSGDDGAGRRAWPQPRARSGL